MVDKLGEQLLAKELVVERLTAAKLRRHQLKRGDRARHAGQVGPDATGQVDIDLGIVLGQLPLGNGAVDRHLVQVGDTYIIRHTGKVVGIDKTKALRETEEDIALGRLLGNVADHHFGGVLDSRPAEHLHESCLLLVERLHHDAQLLTVLRHKVGLTLGE